MTSSTLFGVTIKIFLPMKHRRSFPLTLRIKRKPHLRITVIQYQKPEITSYLWQNKKSLSLSNASLKHVSFTNNKLNLLKICSSCKTKKKTDRNYCLIFTKLP